jgi:hypothetical protein
MAALDNNAENDTLKWLIGDASAVAPVLPLKVALCTNDLVDDSVVGQEVQNSGGSSYSRVEVSFGAVSSGQVANDETVRFENMPDLPITGSTGGVRSFEIWDSASPTPRRWWYALLSTPRSYAAGDAAEFPGQQLVLAID